MRKFSVNCIGFNIETFMIAYADYIKSRHEGWFNDSVFVLEAPRQIYDEIANLKEEMIEILED